MRNLKPIHLEDLTQFKFLANVKHNPQGTLACYVVHRSDLEDNNYKSNLWLYDPANNTQRQLTAMDDERSFSWLDDGSRVLFPSTRDPKDKEAKKNGEARTVFYEISVDGGEAQEAFRVPLNVRSLKVLSEHRYLLLADYDPQEEALNELRAQDKEAAETKRRDDKDYEVLEEIPFWQNGVGFTSGHRSRLYLLDATTGDVQALTEPAFAVEGVELNEERTEALVVGRYIHGRMEVKVDLFHLHLQKRQWTQLAPQSGLSFSQAHFLTNNTVMAAASPKAEYGLNENPQWYRISMDEDPHAPVLVTPDFDRTLDNRVGADVRYGGGQTAQVDGGVLYHLTTDGFHSFLQTVQADGSLERLTTSNGSVDSFSVHDGQVLFIGLRGLALQELYALVDGTESAVTAHNAWLATERTIIEPEPLTIETEPGVFVDGWVLKPAGWQEGSQYPGILNIHGGPKTVYSDVYVHEMQVWAHQGYFVFFCNPRGSDGKGNQFADIRGRYGTIDYDDLMAFTDAVLEHYPSLDPQRLGVTGGSYGGFMTNWIIGHTHRFRAAASQRSISNWLSKFGTTDIGYFFNADQIGATPWSDHEKLWFHSPLKAAHNVQTPTLFIHAEEDYRCWLPEGLQMFTALKYHGVESRLVMFRGENHELSRSGKPKHRLRRLQELTQWFDQYLK